ncbi:MAG: MATE family efflux transporter [Patescibacteria group bacterium]|nr:MATE family efflux transporter [Patescibacteria group bacterium]
MEKQKKLLGEEKISKLLWKLSAPAMVGMLVSALYNLVDTIFVGHGVGVVGIAGIAIVFPISMIIMSLSMMFGIGGASIISIRIGENKKEEAEKVLGNMVTLLFGLGIILTIVGLVFIEPILLAFGATEGILASALEYGRIIMAGNLFFSISVAANSVIRSEGNAKMAMITMLVGALINIILDPIFIFVFDMGLAGAAWATVISQFFSFAYVVYYFVSKKHSMLRIHLQNLKLKFYIVKETVALGISAFVRMAAGSAMSVVINHTLAIHGGDVAIATFGVVNRLLSFVFMPMFGIIQGMQPIVGFNYGAKNSQRVIDVIKLTLKITTIMSFVSFVVLFIFAEIFMKIFSTDLELIRMGSHATRIIIIFLITLGLQVVSSGMYQSMGRAWISFIISSLRQIIFLIPLVIILPIFFDLNGVWYAFPVADFLAFVVSWVLYKREIKLIEKNLA